MDRAQWTVLFAAWLGWGFDVFDGLLFNYVAPNCVPSLLGLPLGSPEAKAATLWWTGLLTSVLLLGWAVGGVVFGHLADRLGRTRTLLLTMALESTAQTVLNLKHSGKLWRLGTWRDGLAFFLGRQGLVWRSTPALLRYLRRDFHPQQGEHGSDSAQMAQRWLTENASQWRGVR